MSVTERQLELELARANAALLDAIELARHQAKVAYNTGDRAQSSICIAQHLTGDQRGELIEASHFHCPSCGHCLKQRSGQRCPVILDGAP